MKNRHKSNWLHMENVNAKVPTLDFRYLAAQTLGDENLEYQLLTLFRAQARQILLSLQNSGFDPVEVNTGFAHLLKGSALAIGATRVAAMAAAYENLVSAPNHAPAASALEALADAVRETISEIDRHIGPL